MRMRGVRGMMIVMACVAIAVLAMPIKALAAAASVPPTTTAPVGNPIKPPSECDGFVGLTHHIAGCIRLTVDQGAERFFTEVYPALQSAIGGIITLAIIIFGVMLSFGLVEKVGRDTFILLIKIAAITAFVTSSPFVFTSITGAMDGATAAVVSYSPPSGRADNSGSDYNQSICMQAMIQAQATADKTKPIITPWLGIDCLIDSVIGIKILPPSGNAAPAGSGDWFNKVYKDTSATAQGSGMARGLLYFFFSSMQSSVMGAVLALIGGFFIYGLMFLIVRAFFGYIAGYMGIALLVIVSPLFIPLILFRDTKQYFDKWAKMLIGFAMQPVIMLVFIIFSLTAVDLAAFSGNYSIMYTIAGDASRTAPFSLNNYLTKPRTKEGQLLAEGAPLCDGCGPIVRKEDRALGAIKTTPRLADADYKTPILSRDLGGITDNMAYSRCTDENIKQAKQAFKAQNPNSTELSPLEKACNAQRNVRIGMNAIDWRLLAAARTPALDGVSPNGTEAEQQATSQKMAQQVIASVFFCVMVVFVLNGILGVVPKIINDLVGDAMQSASLNEIFSSGGMGESLTSSLGGVASRATAPITRGPR